MLVRVVHATARGGAGKGVASLDRPLEFGVVLLGCSIVARIENFPVCLAFCFLESPSGICKPLAFRRREWNFPSPSAYPGEARRKQGVSAVDHQADPRRLES